MGEPTNISLGLRSNPARNTHAGNARLINCYAEETGQDGKTVWTIYSSEGLTPFGSPLEGGGIRAMLEVDGTLFVVAGRNVYAVASGGSSNLIGGIPTDGPVYMDRNRKIPAQIGVVSDGLYFVIDTDTYSVTQISDPDLPSPIAFSTLDGFGIIPVINGNYFITGLDEFTTIDALDEGSCESYPDEIVRSMTLEREAVFFGTDSIEWHQNTGDPDFPFTRVHALEMGCLSGDAVAKVDTPGNKAIIWVAPDHTVRQMSGYSGTVISNNEIEELIKELHEAGDISQLKAFAWAWNGKFCYALTSSTWTRVYNAKTGHWRDAESYGLSRWRVSAVEPFGSKLIAGDYASGQLYTMSNKVFTENNDHLIMTVIPPTVSAYPYGAVFNRLFIDAATGVGINSADEHASAPKIMVSWSDDGGNSWSAERVRELGELGQTFKRVATINRMGRTKSKGRQYRIRISAPVERVLIQMALDYDLLAA